MTFPIPPSLANYPGNKSQSGVYQFIINHIPAHDVRVECFLGSGIISSRIGAPRGEMIIGGDLDETVYEAWRNSKECNWLQAFPLSYDKLVAQVQKAYGGQHSGFIYADPPYLHETRGSMADLYRKEMTLVDHINFLTHVKFWPFNVMISHYPCELYDNMLSGWIKKTFTSQTRGGAKTDAIYMNYDITKLDLHTTKYFGETFTKRQQLQRKAARWKEAFDRMDKHQKQFIIDQLR